MQLKNKRLGSNMRNWTSNPSLRLPRSRFNMSRTEKTAFDSGILVPFEVREVLPGDTWSMRVQSFMRLATPIKPVMDNLRLTFHFWFCPNRQLWENWERFMGAQDDPGDSIDFLAPQINLTPASGAGVLQQADYFGIPVSNLDGSGTMPVSALPWRMYNRVYDYHYRDQDIQDGVPHPTDDGPDPAGNYGLRRRGKRHDYLTSVKPFQQKGDPVPLALGGKAPLTTDASPAGELSLYSTVQGYDVDFITGATSLDTLARGTATAAVGSTLYADLSSTDTTITQLRNSIAVQQILERDARGGTRYAEQLVSRFGVVDPSLLVLQQPMYLGGGTAPVTIAPVPVTQATPAEGETPENVQGNLAAVGTVESGGIGFTQSFTEHGWIMGIVSASADLSYQQGLERQWSKRERFDYFTPELANLSEQPVFSKEIYADGTADDDLVWGYNGAYDEYRFAQSLIKNRFKSVPQSGATLDPWHYSQAFSTRPQLNDAFIKDTPPVKRTLAVQSEPDFIGDIRISATAARILPVTGVPGLTRI